MGISFIIVNYKTAHLVTQLVKSIINYLHTEEFEILIFDNSFDQSEYLDLSKLISSNIFLFSLDKNLGFVKANNYLFKKSKFDLIACVNPDTALIDSSINYMIEFLKENTSITLIGPMLLNYDGSYQVSYFRSPNLLTLFYEHIFIPTKHIYEYPKRSEIPVQCDVVKGAFMIMKRDALNDSYIFDENFIMYSEETDLCRRISQNGGSIYYYPYCKIIHLGGESSGKNILTEYALLHYHRSKLVYFHKHFGKLGSFCAKLIILFSLIEKSMLFFLSGKLNSSKKHFLVFLQLVGLYENRHNL